MVGTAKLAWLAIEEYYISKKENRCKDMIFNKDAEQLFIETFKRKYDDIMAQYMDDSVQSLDRHKQAAILIYCTVCCNIFSPGRELDDDEIFVGEQQVALLLGLSYMKDRLNEILKKHKQKIIKEYVFPKAFSCPTDYFDILTRDLYLQDHRDDEIYILFLSHVLFLVEYYTLRELGVDDSVLREWQNDC